MSTPGLHPLLTETDRIGIRLAALNDCAPETARVQFRRCCASARWVNGMEQARPFADMDQLEKCADRVWASCSHEDWLEAFAAHPRIGDQSGTRWSNQEQSGVSGVASTVLMDLFEANRAYQNKFGFIFIVCATGKSAAEMLQLLKRRIQNTPEEELKIATEQQRLITRLRLRKLLAE